MYGIEQEETEPDSSPDRSTIRPSSLFNNPQVFAEEAEFRVIEPLLNSKAVRIVK